MEPYGPVQGRNGIALPLSIVNNSYMKHYLEVN
jgi:hypothetical protein